MNNVDFACVRRELVSRVVSRGWSVRRNDEVMLLLARPSRRVAAQPVATNVHPPEDRLQFTYTRLDSRSLRVMVQGSVVTNPGSRNEQVTPVQDGPKDQQWHSRRLGRRLGPYRHRHRQSPDSVGSIDTRPSPRAGGSLRGAVAARGALVGR